MSGKRGQKPFKPTNAHRNLVSQLIALHVTWDDIRQLIINPATGEPITKVTLNKFFKRQLAAGAVMLKELAASKYFEALKSGEPWAIKLAMRNRFNWVTEGSQLLPSTAIGVGKDEIEGIQVNLVLPTHKEEPIDVTPSPYQDAQSDYSRPAIEKPPPRETTPTGAVYEHRSYEARMPRAEEPPSIWDRGSKNSWMK
jgi:hypothetical protein